MVKQFVQFGLYILLIHNSITFADPLFCAVGFGGEFTHIDPSIGTVAPTYTNPQFAFQALARSPNGIMYVGTSDSIYTMNPHTGAVEDVIATQPSLDIRGMAVAPDGQIYVGTDYYFYSVDPLTGSLQRLGKLWGAVDRICQGMAFSPEGTLYGITPHVWPGTYRLLTIDLDDLETHLIASYSGTAGINQSLTFTDDGRLYAIGRDVFAQLNPTDGSIIGDPIPLSGRFRGLEIVPEPVLLVDVDIKPGSCPNVLNAKSKGVLPVAILGSEDFDVNEIDVLSIRLVEVAPIRSNYEDVATPVLDTSKCMCTSANSDGFIDLALKFETQSIIEALGEVVDGEEWILELTGLLHNGTPIVGEDCIVIRGKSKL